MQKEYEWNNHVDGLWWKKISMLEIRLCALCADLVRV